MTGRRRQPRTPPAGRVDGSTTGTSADPDGEWHGAAKRARAAVTVLFFANGAMLANWVPRIPEVKSDLALDEGALGAALLGVGLGGLFGSVAAGSLVARLGSRNASVLSAAALGVLLLLPGVAGSWLALIAALTLLGAADGAMDVSMNAHAVTVQQRYPRPILNGFHGWWGLGAAAGAVTGSLVAGAGTGVALHLAVVGGVLALAVLAVRAWLLPTDTDRRATGTPSFTRPGLGVLALGLLTMMAAFVEDTPASWSAVYLREDLAVPPSAAGAGYAAAMVSLTAGRLVADRALSYVGVAWLARLGLIVAGVGLGVGLLLGTVPATVVGFGLVGLGIAPLFPATLGAAGALPGYPAGTAIAVVTLIARGGSMLAPLAIGLAAEVVGLRDALFLTVAVSASGLALTRWLRPARPEAPR